MSSNTQEVRFRWRPGATALALSLAIAAVLHPVGAALEPLPAPLARGLAANAQEARAQLPDGRWLSLARDGATLSLREDRDGGRVLRQWALPAPRRWASLSLLPSGRVLLWGGVDGHGRPHPGGLWFDPERAALRATGALDLLPRAGHAATVLSDGRLLLSGGWTAGGAVAEAELWDERSGVATVAREPVQPARVGHRSRIEADGRVRLSGGIDSQGRRVMEDQWYDPARQDFQPAAAASPGALAAAPRLAGSLPRHQASDVALDARLSLRFDRPVRAAELNRASVALRGPQGPVAAQVTPAEAGRLLFVTPLQALQADTAYALRIEGVHGRDGRALANTVVEFHTGAADTGASGATVDDSQGAPQGGTNDGAASNASGAHTQAPQAATPPASAPKPRASAATGLTVSSASAPASVRTAPTAVTPAAASGTLLADGASLALETTAPDQPAALNIQIPRLGDYGLGLSGLSVTGSSEPAQLIVRRGGTVVASAACHPFHDGCAVDLPQASAVGHTAEVRPPAGATVKFNATLSTDRAVTLQPAPSAQTSVALTRRGQNQRVSFNAQAGASLGVRIASQRTTPSGRAVRHALYAPDGSVLAERLLSGTDALIAPALPLTGRYTLLVDPRYGETANLTVAVGPSNQVFVDGPARDFANIRAPQSISMDLEAGAHLGLGISGLATANGGSVQVDFAAANSGTQASTSCLPANGGCDLNLSGLPAGVYFATVRQPSSATAPIAFTATLSSDQGIELVRGSDSAVNLDRPGRNARLAFDLDPAQDRSLEIAAVQTAPAQRPVDYRLIRPDGTMLPAVSAVGDVRLPLAGLPAGRYGLLIDPQNGETLQASARLSARFGDLQIGGDPLAQASTGSGQTVRMSFANDRDGADLGLGLSEIAVPGGYALPSVVVRGYGGGAVVQSGACAGNASGEGCDLELRDLPAGLYEIDVATPNNATAMSFKATLSEEQTADLLPGQALPVSIQRRGQDAAIGFDAQAGATVNLGVSAQATDPAGRLVTYTVHAPDGSALATNSVGASGSGGLSLDQLPATGRYTLRMDPERAAGANAQIALLDTPSGVLLADGEPQRLAAPLTNQSVRLEFDAQPGAHLSLGLDQFENLTVYGTLTVTVTAPDGQTIATRVCERVDGGCALPLPALAAGRYTVVVDPPAQQPGYAFRATLSSDQEHTLPLDQAKPLWIERAGQRAQYRFDASAGQDLSLVIGDVVRHSQAGNPATPFAYTVYAPDGSILAQRAAQLGYAFRLHPLPQTGRYTLQVAPTYAHAMSGDIRLRSNADAGVVLADGEPLRLTSAFAGQHVAFAFDIGTGDAPVFGGLSVVSPDATSGYHVSYGRQDETPTLIACGYAATGCNLSLGELPPGRYLASVGSGRRESPRTFSVDLALSHAAGARLHLDQPHGLQLRSGQPAALDFAGATAQRMTVAVAGVALTAAGASVQYTVTRPDGSVLASRESAAAFDWALPELPADGDYRLTLRPTLGSAASLQVTLKPTP